MNSMRAIILIAIAATLAVISIAIFAPNDAEPAEAETHDYLIVLGERVGPVTKDTTEAELVARYGAKRVYPHPLHLGEGVYCKATRVDFPDNNLLEILWLNEVERSEPGRISIGGHAWKTAEGMGPNSTLQELERLNGGPFKILSAAMDYYGTVLSWEGGRLAHLMKPGADSRLFIRLSSTTEMHEALTDAERKELHRAYFSSHPLHQRMNPTPHDFFLTFRESDPRSCEIMDDMP